MQVTELEMKVECQEVTVFGTNFKYTYTSSQF